MLIGLFLRHYKIYRAINFIPISAGANLTAYLGANGIGKSSVLDALDKYFNGGDWSINIQAKSDGGITGEDKSPFIMPVFMVEKEKLSGNSCAEVLSNYLWETSYRTTEAFSDFYAVRTQLRKNGFSPETHFLLAIGRQHNKNGGFISSWGTDPVLTEALESQNIDADDITNLLNQVTSLYAYFYIPVEADAQAFSAMESRHVLMLLDEDIKGKIQRSITAKTVETINSSLQEFIKEISESLVNYEYKGSHKNRLTMNDLVEKVFESYFSIKILHGKQKGHSIPVRDMSAGEKRRALIDLSYSLLARSAKRSHSVILAVDEPDASLHTSACHEQFSRLAEIPELTIPKTQVLLTTHWYGFLPIVQTGVAHAMGIENGKHIFHSFDLYNFREQIKQSISAAKMPLAIDVELKSYNDMIQSIVSSTIRATPYNWILCEGLSDKLYLEYYCQDLIKNNNLRILPLGGFKEVRRAYEYLWQPLNDPQYRITGKVLCLVDTDTQMENVELKANSTSIQFSRIIFDTAKNECTIVNVDDQKRSPATEIEQALDGQRFVETVSELEDNESSQAIKDIISNASLNRLSSSTIGFLDLGPSAAARLMNEYFDIKNNKVEFARQYISAESTIPPWIEKIQQYFIAPTKRTRRTTKALE